MQKITPFLWFDKEARQAAEFYTSVFPEAKIVDADKMSDTPSGEVEVITIELFGQQFMLMSAGPVYKINEAISFVVNCDGQEEVDYYWEKLSADPKAEQCGWLKDQFGVSWQVIPKQLNELFADPDREAAGRAQQAMLKMKKIDITQLQKAFDSK